MLDYILTLHILIVCDIIHIIFKIYINKVVLKFNGKHGKFNGKHSSSSNRKLNINKHKKEYRIKLDGHITSTSSHTNST